MPTKTVISGSSIQSSAGGGYNENTVYFQTDVTGSILSASTGFLELVNKKCKEVIGSSVNEFLISPSLDQILNDLQNNSSAPALPVTMKIKDSNHFFSVQLLKAGMNGSGILSWGALQYNMNTAPNDAENAFLLPVITDERIAGNDLQTIPVPNEIKSLRQLAEKLRETEERYSSFINNSTEAIWRFETGKPLPVDTPAEELVAYFLQHGYLAECNQQMAKLYGYEKPDQLIGTPLKVLMSSGNAGKYEYLRTFIKSGFKLLNAETHGVDKDGNKKYFLYSLIGIIENGMLLRIWGTQKDITEQRKIEERMAHHGWVLQNITDVIISTDLDFNIIDWNKAAEEVYGVSAEEVMGKHIGSVTDHKYINSTREQVLKQLYEKESWEGEVYIDRKDGSRAYQVMSLSFVKNERGQRLGFVGIHRDITDRHNSETARQIQEKLLSLEKEVLEINADSTASLKITVDYFLKGVEEIFPGMLCSVLALSDDGFTIQHLSAPNLPVEYCQAVNAIKISPTLGSCGTAMYSKQRIICHDINTDPLWQNYKALPLQYHLKSCWSFPILNAQNEILATICAYHRHPKSPDQKELSALERMGNLLRIIIENKKAEATIKITNERYLLATKATNDAIWDWDIISNSLYWGDGFYTLFGHKSGSMTNSTEFWESQIHPDDRARVLESLQTFINTSTPHLWQDEYRFKKANGKYSLVTDQGFLIYNHEGKVSRMVGSMHDITEKSELEKKLFKQELDKQKMVAQAVLDAQEKDRAEIGKELHDNVNQILSTARLYLDLAKSDEKERMNLIDRSTKNIFDAINEIRNISQSLVPPSIGDLGLIESIQDLMENIKATRKLHVEFYYAGEIDLLVNQNQKLMLFRIIQEQVNNVLRHSEAKNLIVEIMVDENIIELTVSDDGKGFDLNTVNKKGVGLNNITSRTELFNGRVNMVTAPGKGCKLHILVPISNI